MSFLSHLWALPGFLEWCHCRMRWWWWRELEGAEHLQHRRASDRVVRRGGFTRVSYHKTNKSSELAWFGSRLTACCSCAYLRRCNRRPHKSRSPNKRATRPGWCNGVSETMVIALAPTSPPRILQCTRTMVLCYLDRKCRLSTATI